MTTILKNAPLLCVLAAALLSGCAEPEIAPTPPVKAEAPPPPAEPPPPVVPAVPVLTPDQIVLRDGIAQYNNGDFNDAIKKLSGAPEIWVNGPPASQTMALKYMAFSYCVTGKHKQCLQQFEKALKLDPTFDLDPGEKGHPLWGPVFAKAKKGK